jgi:hypothetical protein
VLHIQLMTLGIAVSALAVAGCGGSSKTGSTASVAAATTTAAATATTTTATTTAAPPTVTATTVKVATGKPLTVTTLIAKGDAICARTNTKISTISVKSEADFKRVLPQVAIYNSIESNELDKLVPPASLASDWARIINAAHLYSTYVNRIASDAQTSSYASTSGPLIQTAESVHRQMASMARHDGFKHCAQTG